MNRKSLAIKAANAEMQSHEYERKTTRGLYLPKISFSATYMKFDQDIGLDISGLTDAYRDAVNIPASQMLPNTLVLQKEQFATAGINMVWPIFNGGKIRAANQAMDANINEAVYKIEQTKNALNTELVERYYGYRMAEKAVELYEEVYEAMLLHQQNATKLEENGMIAKAQSLYANIAVSQAKTDLQNAKNTANTVKNALKNTLVDSLDVEVTSELFLIKNIESVEFFQQSALENNPLLHQVDAKRILAQQNYNIKKSDYFPSVAIVGNKEIAEHQLTELMPDWFVGVNLRWTIFDGVSRTYKVKSAKSTIDRVDFLKTKAEIDIFTYINKLYNEMQSYSEQLETMQVTYDFALEYLRVQQKAFTEGFATSKDVVDAQTTLTKVKTGRLKIMNDYVLTLARLLEFSGKPELFLDYSQREDRERESFK
jgi:outer membrane protein TolC